MTTTRKKIDWENGSGRQPSLRDLRVFTSVAHSGSMGKAARTLRVTPPTVSEAIAALEYLFGVKLFDRSSRGVEITTYGAALLKRCAAVFDELKQSSRDIEFLTGSSTGELTIGSSESNAATLLPEIIRRFYQRYPGVALHVSDVPSPSSASPVLRDRSCDLVLTRDNVGADDLNVEILFEDRTEIAVGPHSPWLRRRKIDLVELLNEPWILTGPSTWNYARVAEAFQLRGLGMPKIALMTGSVHLRTHLLANSSFIAAFPRSVLQSDGDLFRLRALPVDLPNRPWPVAVVTMKNRTLSPIVERFIECAREVSKSFGSGPGRS